MDKSGVVNKVSIVIARSAFSREQGRGGTWQSSTVICTYSGLPTTTLRSWLKAKESDLYWARNDGGWIATSTTAVGTRNDGLRKSKYSQA